GASQTIITDEVPRVGGSPQLFTWTTKDGALTRITGITFQGGHQHDGSNTGMLRIQGSSHQFRIDHCTFIPHQTSAVNLSGGMWGVVDHNTFDLSNHNILSITS